MDCIVHGVAKSRTQLSDFHIHIHNGIMIMLLEERVFMLKKHILLKKKTHTIFLKNDMVSGTFNIPLGS